MLEGFRGEAKVSELRRREGIRPNVFSPVQAEEGSGR